MPEMNGYEATLAIRELATSRQIPIIALTAGNVKGERDKCLEVGMDDFISKPFVEDAIWQVFQKYTGLSSKSEPVEEKADFGRYQNEHFDIDKLKEVYMDDEDFIAEFLVLTRDSLLKSLVELNAGVKSGDLSKIKAIGHKLKGAASSAFLSNVTKIAVNLELTESFDKKYITELIDELEGEIEILKPLLVK